MTAGYRSGILAVETSEINIMGGTIIAQGYKGGAGIGGMYADHSNKGMNLVVGNINISGGVVITRDGDWSGPISIGGGWQGEFYSACSCF